MLFVTYSIGYTDQSCYNVGRASNSDDLRMSVLKKNKEGVHSGECDVRDGRLVHIGHMDPLRKLV